MVLGLLGHIGTPPLKQVVLGRILTSGGTRPSPSRYHDHVRTPLVFCSQATPPTATGKSLDKSPCVPTGPAGAVASSSDLGPCMRTCMRVGVYLYRFNNAFFGSLQLPNRLYRVLRRRIHKASAWSQCTVSKRGVEARRDPGARGATIIEVDQILLSSPVATAATSRCTRARGFPILPALNLGV